MFSSTTARGVLVILEIPGLGLAWRGGARKLASPSNRHVKMGTLRLDAPTRMRLRDSIYIGHGARNPKYEPT